MKPIGYARSRAYWTRFAWGTLMGLVGAVAALIYVMIEHSLQHLLWRGEIPITPFSGPLKIVVIMTLAGLVVGIIHKLMPTEEIDVFGAIPKGTMDITHALGAILASMASLVGGFALGPEAPVGILTGGLGVWISKKRRLPKEIVRTNLVSSVAGAFSGLFTAPFGIVLLGLELKHRQSQFYYGTLAIISAASMFGFLVFFTIGGDSFAALKAFEVPSYKLDQWHLLAAILLGFLSVVFTFIFAFLMKTLHQLMTPLHSKPIVRCTAIGLLMGLLGMAMPITLFLGTSGLTDIVEAREELTIGFLVLSALLKIFAMAFVLAAGFIGGPIFPLYFAGGAIGLVVWKLFPGIPIMLAVGCMMAGVSSAPIPFPLTNAIVVLLTTGTPVFNGMPVLISAITSHLIFKGVVLGNPALTGQRYRDIDAALQEAEEIEPEAIL